MAGVMTGVSLVFTTVEFDCYVFMNWCIHTPLSDIQQGWYAGITSPLGTAGHFQQDCLYLGPCNAVSDRANLHTSVMDFSVYTSVRDFSCLYQRQRLFLFIPASETFLVYTSVIGIVYKIHQRPRGGERLAGR